MLGIMHDIRDDELLTPRLSLRRPTPADVDAIFAIHDDPVTCLHNPSDAVRSRAEAEELFLRWDAVWERVGYGYRVVRGHESDTVLGFCGGKPMELRGEKIFNLFYRFDAAAWGHGYAGEAVTAVVVWAVRHLPELPVIARIRPENLASQRVAARAGLVRAAHLDTVGEDGLDWIYTTAAGSPDR
jgi:[ribosomal protein S5]-alanine N-acetyltransferase